MFGFWSFSVSKYWDDFYPKITEVTLCFKGSLFRRTHWHLAVKIIISCSPGKHDYEQYFEFILHTEPCVNPQVDYQSPSHQQVQHPQLE